MARRKQSESWRNAIVRYADEPPESLLANPMNWRQHPQSQTQALVGSLNEVGWIAPVIVNETTQHVVDGHARIGEAIARGEPTVPVAYVNLTEEQERLALATFDPIATMAGTDQKMLDDLLAGISAPDGLEALLASLTTPEQKELGPDDADLTPPSVPITKPGDLWLLGEHRLLCGDATKAEDVARLMCGERATIAVTSPPYNQQIDKFAPSGMHKEGDWVGKVSRLAYPDSMPEDQYRDQQRAMLELWHAQLVEGGSFFYNHKNRYRDKEMISPLAWLPGPFKIRQEIVWSRPGSVTQNARMFLPSDERIYWLYRDEDFVFNARTEYKSWSTVWDIGLEPNREHAAGFPRELPRRCILACSDRLDIVADPYLGSGTTVIVAEESDRRCRGMEREPAYVDVAVRRWEHVTGKKAQRG